MFRQLTDLNLNCSQEETFVWTLRIIAYYEASQASKIDFSYSLNKINGFELTFPIVFAKSPTIDI